MSTLGQRFILRVLGEGRAEYEVSDEPLIIGRDASCDVTIASQYVSRRHARIERHGDVVAVQELGSPNPILVNGHPIKGSQVLSGGDSIQIADVVFDLSPGTPTPPGCSRSRLPRKPRRPSTRPRRAPP